MQNSLQHTSIVCRKPLLSVIIPVYNEHDLLETVFVNVSSALRPLPCKSEIILIDDGSADGTTQVAKGLQARFPALVRLVMHEANAGKGAALRSGLKVATGDIVLIQDADLEYDPADYGKLLTPIFENQADVVFGSRFAKSEVKRVSCFWHYVVNRFLTCSSNMLTNLNLSDMETGYKAFRREVLEGVQLLENGFGIEPEITARVAHRDLRIFEVGISYNRRTRSQGKKIGWRDGVWGVWCIVKYNALAIMCARKATCIGQKAASINCVGASREVVRPAKLADL